MNLTHTKLFCEFLELEKGPERHQQNMIIHYPNTSWSQWSSAKTAKLKKRETAVEHAPPRWNFHFGTLPRGCGMICKKSSPIQSIENTQEQSQFAWKMQSRFGRPSFLFRMIFAFFVFVYFLARDTSCLYLMAPSVRSGKALEMSWASSVQDCLIFVLFFLSCVTVYCCLMFVAVVE